MATIPIIQWMCDEHYNVLDLTTTKGRIKLEIVNAWVIRVVYTQRE